MLVTALTVAALLSFRWFSLVDAYAVNVFIADQWDYWEPMFRDAPLLEKFFHQHGPHFMGVSYLVIDLVGTASSWNVRAEAFVLVALSVFNTALALWLKHRLVGRWHAWDALIPLMILSFKHHSVYLMGADPLNVVPLVLVLATALFWTAKSRAWRYGGVLGLNALAVWTSFAFLSTFVVLALLALEMGLRGSRKEPVGWEALGMCAAAVPLVLAFRAFDLGAGAPSLISAGYSPSPYLRFLEALWGGNFLIVRNPLATHCVFGVVLLLHGLLARWMAQRILHEARDGCVDRAWLPVAYLVGYSGLFAATCVLARAGLGSDAAYAARYLMHLVPFGLGLYVFLLLAKTRWRHPALAILGLSLLWGEVAAYHTYERTVIQISRGGARWVRAYLATKDVERANRISRFKVYPWDDAQPRIQERLEYMERHQLGLFSPRCREGDPPRTSGERS
jgi:hypothetical protein